MVTLKTTDNRKALMAALKSVQDQAVYVGVPEAEASRSGEPVNNAELVYIHTHGSPLRHIPARPIIEPAIEAEDNRKHISDELNAAVRCALHDDQNGVHRHLTLAGQEGMTAAVKWFDDPRNGWAPNTDATVRAKLKKAYKGRQLEKAMLAYQMGVEDLNKVLVDTSVMRNSITFVVNP